ncbi:MAG: purine-binding chemotaxis protein CheW [Nitrospinae bacterium]|nr:purine-binding chemotaxis protein CheW [Nitrospinota bacterium]
MVDHTDLNEFLLDEKILLTPENVPLQPIGSTSEEGNELFSEGVDDENTLHFVGFRFADEEYILEIQLIQEIIMVGHMTYVPHVAEYFEGVINLRGNIVPVINLRLKLGMEAKEKDNDSRIIIMDLNDMVVGFLVDKITKVIRLPKDNIEPPSTSFGEISEEFINGIGRLKEKDGIVGWLNVNKIIETELSAISTDS